MEATEKRQKKKKRKMKIKKEGIGLRLFLFLIEEFIKMRTMLPFCLCATFTSNYYVHV